MQNVAIAYNNEADAATFSDGSYSATFPVTNLSETDTDRIARTSSAALASTFFRFKLAAAASIKMFALSNHNASASAQYRLRLGTAPFDVDFESGAQTDSRITWSGGADGTSVGSTGLIASDTAPRINYNPATLSCNGLLIEEQRTNLLLYASGLNAGNWITASTTVSTDATTSPDGTSNAETLAFVGAGQVYQNVTVAINTAYAMTSYGKMTAGTGSYRHKWYNAATALDVFSADYPITTTWSRNELDFTTGANVTSFNLAVANAVDGTNRTIAAYGIQLEAGAFATSYIPTSGTQVTRTADSALITGTSFSDTWSATAGTLYAEFNLISATGTRPVVSIDDNTSSERFELYCSGTSLKFRIIDGGVTQADITLGTVAAGTFYKVAVSWSANDIAGSLSGGAVVTDTSATLPTVSRMRLGSNQAGDYLNGHIKRVTYWPTAFSDANLQSVSTTSPDAVGYNSGWVNCLRRTFYGSTPATWGQSDDIQAFFTAVTAQYGIFEISDTANTAGYLQYGRPVIPSVIFRPAANPSQDGQEDGHTPNDRTVYTPTGKKYSNSRIPSKTTTLAWDFLEPEEGDHMHEIQSRARTSEEMYYIPDADDAAKCQQYGFLGTADNINPIRHPLFALRANSVTMRQKL